MSIDFTRDLLMRAFFWRGDDVVCHSALCLFDSGSILNIQQETLNEESHSETCNKKKTFTPNRSNDVEVNRQEITFLNQNDVLETIYLASDEMLESIQFEDSTIVKILVNNNSKHRIQVVAWNEEIDRINFYIQPNRIVHIDGAKAKKVKIPEFNQGTLQYELIIRSNTTINTLGNFDLKKNIQAMQPQLVELCDVPQYLNACIIIRGYIKTNFNKFLNSFKTIGCGSITDKMYKLEIQIVNYDNDVYFDKGQMIEMKGYVKIMNDIFYLEIDHSTDIKQIGEEKLSFQQLLLGTRPIVKKTSNEDLGLPPRKMIRK
ncbi:uncharacterized protein LOC114931302 [Nylanderia fulva]|uniref:uncharacterized protein LOC114931302 n=1 Tax=Nylanderia fulva TaxID=613905 RepID=UPI0010FB58B0|nr:uncharacterized protein LOC114931302 [Nylanderia fulva]